MQVAVPLVSVALALRVVIVPAAPLASAALVPRVTVPVVLRASVALVVRVVSVALVARVALSSPPTVSLAVFVSPAATTAGTDRSRTTAMPTRPALRAVATATTSAFSSDTPALAATPPRTRRAALASPTGVLPARTTLLL